MSDFRKNERGFTLVETMLVLSIVMVITTSVVYVTTTKVEAAEEKRFFRQFHLDVQRLQSIAIGENKYTYLNFDMNGSKYIAKSANIPLFEYEVPKHMRLSIDSYLKGIAFHPNGAVSQFGTFTFDTRKGHKIVTVYIGNGRLMYEE
ncbi:competence type IV pilus minor pilin ComGD [Psychrobacillus sp. NPDC096426]|uniref:competence type IV pilus minor pilin ComGD n=1 Tax=Psychrobacillus sp. NPDC096426 TaxID=3364491 RepID=UPI003821B269